MIGFLDCYSGISGDMLLGALVDAGLPLDDVRATVEALGIGGEVEVVAATVARSGLRATKVSVLVHDDPPHRTFPQVAAIVDHADLPPAIRATSLKILRRIAEVEAWIHGCPLESVELHEVGALDALVDVVACVAGLARLGIERLGVSALPVAPGGIEAVSHHGRLPTPAPATLALLAAARAPLRPFGDGRELVTPTGAALAVTLGRFEQPAMRVLRVGYGAGTADLPWPNLLRLWIGEPLPATAGATAGSRGALGAAPGTPDDAPRGTPGAPEPGDMPDDAPRRSDGHIVLETNLDDMNPQLLAPVLEGILAAGALDVTASPLQMKKGRPGTLVCVIARAADEDRLAGLLLRETTTLGVRVHDIRRHEAGRRYATVETPFGPVTIKCKVLDDRVVGVTPEFESVRAAAGAVGAPLATVHAAAAAAALALLEDR